MVKTVTWYCQESTYRVYYSKVKHFFSFTGKIETQLYEKSKQIIDHAKRVWKCNRWDWYI